MCDSSAGPALCLNPPALFDVLWPLQWVCPATSPNISLGFPLKSASAIGQVCGLSQSHQTLCLGEEDRSSQHLEQAIEYLFLFQRGN